MTKLNGRGAAPGTAMGRAVIAVRAATEVRYRLAASGVERERQRLRIARDHTRRQLEEISSRISRSVGPAQAAIFAAQLLMLDDPLLVSRADALIRSERINADWALQRAVGELRQLFVREGDAWLAERAGDLVDVTERLQRNIRPDRDPLVDLVTEVDPPLVLVADELPPSVAAQLDWSRVRGLVCDIGSPTHHTVILARSLGVPTVVGLSGATQAILPGQVIALDGATGEVVIDPTAEVIERWQQRGQMAMVALAALDELRALPAVTLDGVHITIEANLEIADEIGRVQDAGAEGIGLYRSEFLLDGAHPDGASEAAQERVYRSLLAMMRPLPVTVRTFDAGGERWSDVARQSGHRERFGVRGIRSGLRSDERFRGQIRALLRSADAGELRILLPFVTSADEMRQARALIASIAREAGLRGDVPIGAMIEIPAAALTADHLAADADFLSVGTNDLIQYTLAMDRTDERLAGQYEPASPAVLRLLRIVAQAGRRMKRPLSVCGEMAADPLMAALLVGLGFRQFSMSAAAIPIVKRSIGVIDSRTVARVARQAVRMRSAADVHALLAPVADAMHELAMTQAGREEARS
jgi:phosphotransferase system enzyme I (PtsI)